MKLLLLPLLIFVLFPLGAINSQPLDSSKQYVHSEYNGGITLNDYLPIFELKDSSRNEYIAYIIDINSIEAAYLFNTIDFSRESSFELINKKDREQAWGYGIVKSKHDALWYCKTESEIEILSIINDKKTFVLFPLGAINSQPLDSSKYVHSEYGGGITINEYLPIFELKDSSRNEYIAYIIDMNSIETAYLFNTIDFSRESSFELINKKDREQAWGYGIVKSKHDALWYCKTESEIEILSIINGEKKMFTYSISKSP